MGAPAGVDVEALRAELDATKAKKEELEQTVKDLNSKLNV